MQVLLLLVERAGEVVTREQIQQIAWADDTNVDFEVGINRCIRRIRAALVDDADAPRYLETVPRVGYRFIAPVEISSSREASTRVSTKPISTAEMLPLVSATHSSARWRLWTGSISAVAACVVLAALWWFTRSRVRVPSDLELVPLAVSLGEQYTPSFSPDGRQVAFTWNGENQDNFDIYLKLANSSSPNLRLTRSNDVDYSPAWSPDGQWIAFCRGSDTPGGAIWVVPALGGAERKIADLNSPGSPWNRSLAWSRDSRSLVVASALAGQTRTGLHLVDVSTGAIRRVTKPKAGEEDMYPAVSPDGETIAFTRDTGRGISAILLVPFGGGTPRELAAPQMRHIYNAKPAWTPDGRYVAFVSNQAGYNHLWISSVHNSQAPLELPSLGDDVQDAFISATGQLGVVQRREDSNLWSIELQSLSRNEHPKARRLFASTRAEETPAVRQDRKQIAFASNRSGFSEIWTGRTDGTDAMQVTFLRNPVTGSPDWSPDGRQLVFDSRAAGQPDLYVMSADGGKARLLPTGNGMSVTPHWSPNGSFIYFSSDRTGQMEVWRVPLAGGKAEQITDGGGFAPIPSADGQHLYYSANNDPVTSLWGMQIATGKRTLITSSVLRRAYTPGPAGVYFFTGSRSRDESHFNFFDLRTHNQRALFKADHRIENGITLTSDGRTLYYTQWDASGDQLMLVQNFWR